MKKFLFVFSFAALCAFGRVASADILNLASYGALTNVADGGQPYTPPAGIANSYLLYVAPDLSHLQLTFNLPNTAPWASALGSSSWVSYQSYSYPFGPFVAPNATYTYFTTFFDPHPDSSSGTITVLADDTASVYLNGTLITAGAANIPANYCTQGVPNCRVPSTFTLTGFVAGTNTLTFNVSQLYAVAEGLDFIGTVNTNAIPGPGSLLIDTVNTSAVPEPGSLLLLSTGLLASAGMYLRRFRG